MELTAVLTHGRAPTAHIVIISFSSKLSRVTLRSAMYLFCCCFCYIQADEVDFFLTPNTKHLTSSLKHTSFKIPLHLFNSDGPAVRLFTSMLKMKHDLVSFGNPILAYCFFYDNSVLEIIPPHFWWKKCSIVGLIQNSVDISR